MDASFAYRENVSRLQYGQRCFSSDRASPIVKISDQDSKTALANPASRERWFAIHWGNHGPECFTKLDWSLWQDSHYAFVERPAGGCSRVV